MKYQVQIQYTNPSHEHVSLRRRVESITRVVEAANETEALNRAANQQRSLGFLIKEAAVMNSPKEENLHADEKEKKKKKVVGDDHEETDIAASGGVKEAAGTASYPLLKKGEKLKPMKLKEGFDPDPKEIAAHLVDKHGKGKVTKDHVDAYEKDRDSNKGIDKEAVMKHVQKMSEEVETVDEAQKKLKPSYWRAEWRLGTQSEVDKNNKKIFDKLAKTDPVKASAFHDNLMRMKKKDMKEEVVAEASKEAKDVMRGMRASLKSMDLRHGVDSDKRVSGYKMSPAVKAAQAKSDALSKTVKRPQAGTLAAVHKSMEREMLKKEAVENNGKQKARKAAEKMVNRAKGKANKINMTPELTPGEPNA